MQSVDVAMPVPRDLPLAGALAWAAEQFQSFRDRGWDVESEWMLELGTDARLGGLVPGRPGRLSFRAVWGRQTGKAGGEVVAGVQVWADGGVRWQGQVSEAQRHVVLTALGVSAGSSSSK